MKDENNPNEYQNYIDDSLKDFGSLHTFSDEGQNQIVKIGKNMARKTNIMISLAILLLVVPIMTLATYMYYSFGSKADHLIDIVTKTIYVTEPNMSLEKLNLEDDIGFFSMNITFDVFKRIGKEDYRVGNYDLNFFLDQPSFPKKNLYLDRPLAEIPNQETEFMIHPEATLPFSASAEWDRLKKLPNGTVSEVYVSLNQLMKPDKLKESLPKNMELRWLAVDTGLEAKQVDHQGVPITAIGYPAQYDLTTWSPFKTNEQSNEEVFLDILALLNKNEAVAEKVARAKSLSISDRLAFIKQHGINIYGAVITGPTEEIRKLQGLQEIRAIKVGEVKLWNWE